MLKNKSYVEKYSSNQASDLKTLLEKHGNIKNDIKIKQTYNR